MKTLLLVVSVLAACGGESAPVQARPQPPKPHVFLQQAVTEGLKEDGPDRALVKECFANKDLFVLKCPICEPVREAIGKYAFAEDKVPAGGKGLPKDIVDDLKSPLRVTQLKAVERLVDRWITRHYERLGLNDAERRTLMVALLEMKKEGMKMKELGPQKNFGDFCPSCNGATRSK